MTFRGEFDRALRDYVAHLGIERSLSDNTLGAYRRDLTHYKEHLELRSVASLAAISPEDAASFVEYLRDGSAGSVMATSSVARMVTAVRRFHEFLLAEGITTTDASADLHPPKIGMRLPKAITIPEMEQLLAVVARGDDAISTRDRALLEILYGTGARISEVVGLTVDDMSCENATIRLFGKGRKERILPLGTYAIEAIRAYLNHGRTELVARSAAPRRRSSSINAEKLFRAKARGESSKPLRKKRGLPIFLHTRSATRSQPTSCKAEQTCAWCKKCWGIPPSPQRKFIRK